MTPNPVAHMYGFPLRKGDLKSLMQRQLCWVEWSEMRDGMCQTVRLQMTLQSCSVRQNWF